MNLQDIRVLILSQYAAPYEGNFILSLKHLESNLSEKYNAQIAYVFPMAAKAQPWYEGFIKQHKTYLTTVDVHHSEKEVLSIIVDFNPNLVHTHFDGYDVPCAKAINAYENEKGETINMVWHLHDTLGYVSNPIKRAYQFYSFLKHYGWYGRHTNIIAVSSEVAEFVSRFKKRVTLSPYKNLWIVANGVDFSRLTIRGG